MAEFTAIVSSVNWVCSVSLRPWQVYMDGASNARGVGVGIVLVSPEGVRLEHSLRQSFMASNNKAKYEALIAGLKVVKKLDAQVVEILFIYLFFFFSRFSLGVKPGRMKFRGKGSLDGRVFEDGRDVISQFPEGEGIIDFKGKE